jgi:hypothetical protein
VAVLVRHDEEGIAIQYLHTIKKAISNHRSDQLERG